MKLEPWALFAIAAGVKYWRITAVFRRRGLNMVSSTAQARQLLEQTLASES